MTKFARIVGDLATDVTLVSADELKTRFHPDLLSQFEPVPDEVVEGSIRTGDVWTPPA